MSIQSPDQGCLPVFVYGTLRPGLHNYERILDGNTSAESDATLSGYTMLSARAFPFIAATKTVADVFAQAGRSETIDPDNVVVGTLCYLDGLNKHDWHTVMERLDYLEGYYGPGDGHSLYHRVVVTATDSDDNQVEAYTYVTAGEDRLVTMPVVEDGDWLSHLISVRA